MAEPGEKDPIAPRAPEPRRKHRAGGPGGRPGNAEVARRLDKVEELMVLQMTPREVQVRIARDFGVSERHVRNDINKIYERWAEQSETERPRRKEQLRNTLKKLLQVALTSKNVIAAVMVCDRLAKLDGLEKPTEVVVTNTVELKVADMTTGDRRRRLAELMLKHAPHLLPAATGGTNGVGGNGVH